MKTNRNLFIVATIVMITILGSGCSKDDIHSDDNNSGDDPNEYVLQGDIKEDLSLEGGHEYTMNGGVNIIDGATLTIPAGTTIKAGDKQVTGSAAYLLVEQGAKLIAEGTADAPIVFTSNTHVAGAWGGIHLCGKAPINPQGGTATSEIGDKIFGGNDANDDSGSLSYVRVEYGGAQITPEVEHNGFSFYGVGKGTNLDHLEAYSCADDGFEWFGGTVNAKYLISKYSGDDLFDWTFGWNGNGQFFMGIYSGSISSEDPRGIEADNNEDNNSLTPISNPNLSNITLDGQGIANEGMMLRRGTHGKIYNAIVKNFKNEGIEIRNDKTVEAVNSGSLKVDYLLVDNMDINYGEDSEDTNVKVIDSKRFEKSENYINESITLIDGKGVYSNKGFDATVLDPSFFEKANYIGAVNPSKDWTLRWSR